MEQLVRPVSATMARLALDVKTVESAFAAEEVLVVRRASAELGYQHGRIVIDRDEANLGVIAFLTGLGITPLDPKKVAEYKREKAAAEKAALFQKENRTANFTWRTVELGSYARVVPVHVLALALQLNDAWKVSGESVKPNSTLRFLVEELAEERIVAPDPFLIAQVRGSNHYIAVWDEPAWR